MDGFLLKATKGKKVEPPIIGYRTVQVGDLMQSPVVGPIESPCGEGIRERKGVASF